jgi:hypothetical protein
MKFGRLALIFGTLVLGVIFVVSGIYMVTSGLNTRSDIKDALTDERLNVPDPQVLLTYPGARAPEGVEVPEVLIDTADEADAQAQVIRTHVLEITDGQTYAEMDRDDPNRDTYLNALTLQSALHQAYISFEITRLVIGLGALVIVLGAGTIGLGVPLAYLATNPKRERETSTEESPAAARKLALEEG